MSSESMVSVAADWPRMSLAQVEAVLTAPGQRFETDTVSIRGIETRVWKYAPPSLRVFTQLISAYGDAPVTVYEGERVSYAAQYRAIAKLAHWLRDMGVRKGDRVAIAMRNLPEWPVAFFAATSIGAIAVPLNAWWTGAELEYGLADSGARVLFLDGERLERIAPHLAALKDLEKVVVSRHRGMIDYDLRVEALDDIVGPTSVWADLPQVELPEAEILPDDDCTIFYTSGTTGAPKGALGTHRNICSNIMTSGYVMARSMLRDGEVPPQTPEPKAGLLVIPFFHVTGCSAAMMLFMATGSKIVLMRRWDALEAMRLIEREKIQTTGGVPTIAWQLIEHPERENFDLSSLESISYGGAPSAPELVRSIHQSLGAMPGNGWGMTETMATVTQHVGADYINRPTSCGPAVPVAQLKIMAPDGSREMPVGEVGELWAKGPMVVKGYWNKPEATAETFIDGWVRTGDLAKLDEEGFCYIVDRAKDVIIRGGENIYSIEVEDVLYAHPAVTDCALIGIPHRTLGEQPAAVIHLAPGMHATAEQLQEWVRERLAAFKVPVAIRFVDEVLPRNANGKILKKELKALFADEPVG